MALNTTVKKVKELLDCITVDLEKAVGGNKAAAQRVRVATVKLEKAAKLYRKESVANEKKSHGKKKVAKHAAKGKAKPKESKEKKATAKLPKKKTKK